MMGPNGVIIGGGSTGDTPAERGGNGGFPGAFGSTIGALILLARDFLGLGTGLCTASMSIALILKQSVC